MLTGKIMAATPPLFKSCLARSTKKVSMLLFFEVSLTNFESVKLFRSSSVRVSKKPLTL